MKNGRSKMASFSSGYHLVVRLPLYPSLSDHYKVQYILSDHYKLYRRYFHHAHFIPIVGVGKRGEY